MRRIESRKSDREFDNKKSMGDDDVSDDAEQQLVYKEREQATRNLIDQLAPFVGMLVFVDSDGSVTNNGTASFVAIGHKKLVVTCAHVVEGFRDKKEKQDKGLWMALALPGTSGSAVQLMQDRIIDCGSSGKLDIATMSLQEPDIIQEYGKRYFQISEWPPPRPGVGALMGIVGCPAQGRIVHPGKMNISFNALSVTISAVSDRCITAVDEDNNRVVVALNPSLGNLAGLGGMSGSAAYELNSDSSVRLIGFLCEGGESGGASVPIRVAHADFITQNGTLDFTRLCW